MRYLILISLLCGCGADAAEPDAAPTADAVPWVPNGDYALDWTLTEGGGMHPESGSDRLVISGLDVTSPGTLSSGYCTFLDGNLPLSEGTCQFDGEVVTIYGRPMSGIYEFDLNFTNEDEFTATVEYWAGGTMTARYALHGVRPAAP